MPVVDRVCGHSGTLTGGFLRASSQRPDGESCLALPMEQSIGKANPGRTGSKAMFEIWYQDNGPCKVEVHGYVEVAQMVWDTLAARYEMMNRRP